MSLDLDEMRKRAEAWLKPPSLTTTVTRETALNEEHLALDVIELIDEVESLRAERNSARANASILAHAYTHDSRPPQHVVDEASGYPKGTR